MSSADDISSSSNAASEKSQSSTPAVPYAKALDKTFISHRVGIRVKYPSTLFDTNCQKDLPVVAEEKDASVVMVPQEVYGADCKLLTDPQEKIARQSDFHSTIYVQRATTDKQVRQFIDRVFSPDCKITEQNDYQGVTRLFLASKHPSANEPDFICGESVEWQKSAGVILFSSLGSKTGGAVRWPSRSGILMPDGSIEGGYDFLIVDSVVFLKP